MMISRVFSKKPCLLVLCIFTVNLFGVRNCIDYYEVETRN